MKIGNKTKQGIIYTIIAIIALISFYFLGKYLFKNLAVLTALSLQKGFKEMFSGSYNFSYFTAAISLTAILFLFIFTPFFYFFLLGEEINIRRKLWGIPYASLKVIEKHKNTFLLIFTITLSIVLMYAGTSFLSNAFPDEPIFKNISGSQGSILKCKGLGYSNIISQFDIPCDIIQLSENLSNKKISNAQIRYYINRTEFSENISNFGKNGVNLYFDKNKKPQLLIFIFDNDTIEVYSLNTVGVYTKEEYFEREKDKAMWFFAIISFSFFSVFSGMNSLKQILGWK